MAETFYEGDVRLNVRLDELNRQLDQAEATIHQRTRAVVQQQQQVVQSVQVASESGGGFLSTAGGLAKDAAGAFLLWRGRTLLLTSAMGALKTVGTAALRVLGPAAWLAVGTAVVNTTGRIESATRRASEAIRQLDGTREAALRANEALSDIPIVGGAASLAFRAQSDQFNVLGGFLVQAREGRVEMSRLGRTFDLVQRAARGMRRAIPAVTMLERIAKRNGVSFKTLGEEIQEVNAHLDTMAQRAAVIDRLQPGFDAVTDAAGQRTEQLRRAAEMAAASPAGRIDLRGEFAAADVNTSARQQAQQVNRPLAQDIRNIRASELSIAQQMIQVDQARTLANRALSDIEADRVASLEQVQRLTDTLADAEQRRVETARRLARAQANQDTFAFFREVSNLRLTADAAEADAAGRGFDAQRIRNEASRRSELARADTDAARELINRRYDARLEEINRREREEVQQQAELADERARRQLEDELRRQQELDQVLSRTREARLRAEGRDAEAAVEAINSRFAAQIEQAVLNGREDLADALRNLRDAEIEGVTTRRPQRASAEQVSASRFAAGRGEDDRVLREQLGVLARIERNTRGGTTAVLE